MEGVEIFFLREYPGKRVYRGVMLYIHTYVLTLKNTIMIIELLLRFYFSMLIIFIIIIPYIHGFVILFYCSSPCFLNHLHSYLCPPVLQCIRTGAFADSLCSILNRASTTIGRTVFSSFLVLLFFHRLFIFNLQIVNNRATLSFRISSSAPY